MNNEFSKTLKNDIIYLPELPSDNKYIENTAIAVPAEKEGRFNVYMWFDDKWEFMYEINKSDFKLNDLADIYNDLTNVINKLTKITHITANTKNTELFLKLSKITNKVLQAKFELADDVLEPFEKTCNAVKDYKRAEQQQEYFEHQLEEALKDKDNKTK